MIGIMNIKHYLKMSLPFDQNNSFKSQYFEMEGVKYRFVGCESTGLEAIESIDEFRDLSTNQLYKGSRLSIIKMMIEKKAKIICNL